MAWLAPINSRSCLALSVTIVTHFTLPCFLACEVVTHYGELWCAGVASLRRK